MAEFAREQLLKSGWSEGAGLGRNEAGIKEAIKVVYKFDTAGVGHDPGAAHTNHWWDDVFNKAAGSIQVAEDGGSVSASGSFSLAGRERRADLLYGRFVSSGVLADGVVQGAADSSSSDEEAAPTTPGQPFGGLSDEQIMKACGGRTAHKGARHGLKASAKLARIERHEAAPADSAPPTTVLSKSERRQRRREQRLATATSATPETAPRSDAQRKEEKKSGPVVKSEAANLDSVPEPSPPQEQCLPQKVSKKKRRKMNDLIEAPSELAIVPSNCAKSDEATKKKKRRRVDEEALDASSAGTESVSPPLEQPVEVCLTLKKKKKKKKHKENADTAA